MLSYEGRPPSHRVVPSARPNPTPISNVDRGHHQQRDQSERRRHIWIITGPAGCGKTTVAKYIAEQLDLPYIEGDEVRSRIYVLLLLLLYGREATAQKRRCGREIRLAAGDPVLCTSRVDLGLDS